MESKCAKMSNILLPVLLLAVLMTTSLLSYPIIFEQSKFSVVLVFIAIILYSILWKLIRPDKFTRNGGLLIGSLFVANIAIEEFINCTTRTETLISTLGMMFIIFFAFARISSVKTRQTHDIFEGIKSSFLSAILGTTIALCFGFLINYIFADHSAYLLQSYPGSGSFSDPHAFTFFNAFNNASSHVIIAPVIAIIMGTLGGATELVMLNAKKSHRSF